ncbi:MAG: M48 family metalloprotease [Candidatus Nanoarchaeia archaeon]
MAKTFFDEIRRNKLRSTTIIIFFILFVLVIGGFIGYYYSAGAQSGLVGGIIISFLVAGLYLLIAYNSGGSMVLSATGAKPVSKQEYPHLVHTVEGLAIAAGIPAPKAYVIKDSALNAFATGNSPKKSAIVVTTGLLDKLNREELEGVIAHEMSHIKNYDIRVMLLATVLVGVLTLISDILLRTFLFGGARGGGGDDSKASIIFVVVGVVLVILSPLIGQLIKLSVSRKREYLADASGAMLTRYPQGLANALKKIKEDPDPLVDHANKATAHLFISTPFRKRKGVIHKLFSTHPPISARIKRLEAM